MFKFLLLALIIGGGAWALWHTLPDIQRYLRMSSM